MRGSLICEDVGQHSTLMQFWNHVGAIANQSDRDRFFFSNRVLQNAQRFVEGVDHEVAVAGLQPLFYSLCIDIDAKETRAGHSGCKWLRPSHTTHAATDDE